jgi:hypothetical protein
MKPFQLSAIKYLSAYGFINNEQLSEGIFQRTKKKLPVALKAKMDNLDVSSEYICRLVSSPLNSIPLLGERGLKYRTKLLDFNHDPI